MNDDSSFSPVFKIVIHRPSRCVSALIIDWVETPVMKHRPRLSITAWPRFYLVTYSEKEAAMGYSISLLNNQT